MAVSSTVLPTLSEQPKLHQADFLQQVAASFGKASDSYLAAARLQQQVARDALALLAADGTGRLLDAGCGPGWIHPEFKHYCTAFTAVDLSEGMLNKARYQQLASEYIQADAAVLPLPGEHFAKVFSSLMLQWCPTPGAVLSEFARVLAPGGKMVVTTLVQGTLQELQQAFATLDQKPHTQLFLPEAALIDQAKATPAVNWQFDLRSYPLYYPDVQSLARELKAIGANQVAGRSHSGLTGKGYWQKLAAAYEIHRTGLGLPASYQVLVISGTKDAR
ncbi:methyltransferase domain-containing protein [Arsukibacterium indicum]|uniref:Methyltransferase domain-containing protein n=1 Tax=Arsukibacterium indicum TaxID=2848612 RepID=A0ABS6MNL8_9GAMM|nr:methyltransferase domain-containing protein [Arsukibacterium indicum]MBV2129926.1 methyltransferase domain-containing protein [Arsukibacterium indicum]